jgi:hypothetical protein
MIKTEPLLWILIAGLAGMLTVIWLHTPKARKFRVNAAQKQYRRYCSQGRKGNGETLLILCQWLHLLSYQESEIIRLSEVNS